ncbi:MAG: hypothetical protein OXC40_05220 [Proteobacteria bacterium]|nr:hypothetical protein [Pseudomonadota bacterium]
MIIKLRYFVCHMTLMIWLSSCFGPSSPLFNRGKNTDNSLDVGQTSSELTDEVRELFFPKDPVLPAELKSEAFKVIAPQISWQRIDRDREYPVIDYMMPKKADYIEILRCQASLELLDVSGITIREVLVLPSRKATQSMIVSSLWRQALDSRNCVSVGFKFSAHSVFTDTTATSGSYYYLARACVRLAKIPLAERIKIGANTCSPFVAQTDSFEYLNQFESKELQKFSQLRDLGFEIQRSLIDIEKDGVKTVDALEQCDVADADRQKRVRKKQALNVLIGSVGGVIASASLSGASTLTDPNSIWDRAGNLGTRMAEADYLSKGFIGILNDFTTSVDDFPKSCYKADTLFRQLPYKVDNIIEDINDYMAIVRS